jgi:hypothetical protein
MRILFIGCSWSQIVPRAQGEHSCPAAEFSKLLDTPHRIDISATGGSCIELHLEWLKQALAIAEYDFIFFQITASSRNYLRKEEWSEFTNNDWKYDKPHNLYHQKDYAMDNYVWNTTSGWVNGNKHLKRFSKTDYLFRNDHVYRWEATVNQVERYLTFKKIPFIMYHHTLNHLVPYDDFLIKESDNYFCIEKFLGKKFKKYCIDKGSHFNAEGNRVVATQLYSLYKDITS